MAAITLTNVGDGRIAPKRMRFIQSGGRPELASLRTT